MNFPATCQPLKRQVPAENEIAALALKFYLDNNCEHGHDRENRLCAEYMLVQKDLIECQLDSIHFHQREMALSE